MLERGHCFSEQFTRFARMQRRQPGIEKLLTRFLGVWYSRNMKSIQLNESVAAALSAQATALGLTVEAYLENVVLSVAPQPGPRLSLDELDRLLDEEASNGPSPVGSFSRAELYSDHD